MELHEVTTGQETQLTDYEIERGKPKPSTVHAFVSKNLLVQLEINYRKRYTILPELSLEKGEDSPPTVPDIAIYPKFKIDVHHDTVKRKDMPVGVIEILSPSQSFDGLIEKATAFLISGVKSVWIVAPNLEAVFIYHTPNRYDFFEETTPSRMIC